ncbi:type II toxin-antitoxin system Phd/YefM family antitoxin [Chloroflexi bacterium TSY]|nr:type II toxin-antitoxin system Phd/YefM family antitoxin [Chloroflexi bacterium TSY]
MERRLNVTEARNQLPTLVKEVSEKNNQIIISTRNEPKAIIMGYDAFRQQQERLTKGARYRLPELMEKVQNLLEQTLEGCRGDGEPILYSFWTEMGRLMREAWELYEVTSRPHASIAFQLFELSERCITGDTMLKLEQLQSVSEVLTWLKQDKLTMENAAEMDRYLLQHDIDARYPAYIDSDLNALYETDEDEDDYREENESQ